MIGERIRKLRSEQGISQEQLADLLGVSRQAVSKWEVGESTPDTERVMQLCRVLNVSADFLLFGKTEEKPEPVPDAPQPKAEKQGIWQRVVGWSMIGVGGLGVLVMWVLSAMLLSERWEEVAVTDAFTGNTYYSMQHYGVYDFTSFIETYRLQALLTICIVLMIAGIALLVWKRIQRWFQD